MNAIRTILVLVLSQALLFAGVFPGSAWQSMRPADAGLDSLKLVQIKDYLGGRGCIVRNGYMVYTWGDQTLRADIASACKPWYSTFLFKAVEDGKLASVDEKAVDYWPCLNDLNASLGYKDRNITFRHMANQISCYGVRESPGAAYDYNDWQMALFWDVLFTKVYGTTYSTVDALVLHPLLTDLMQCQDNPTMMAFGTGDRPGRVGVSVRDFARFGLLYLNKGNWNGTRVISEANAIRAVTEPLSNSIPRTTAQAASMCSGQRTIGSGTIPDNQIDHMGSYSWLWWVNGTNRNGQKWWPGAPDDVAACLGHANGKRGMCFIPSMGIVMSWNDTKLDQYPSGPPHPLNTALEYLVQADNGGADSTAPSVPQNFGASPLDGSRIALTWSTAADDESGISGYVIYRDNVSIDTLGATTSCTDQGLLSETQYSYQVAAINGAGMEGGKSAEATATTLSSGSGLTVTFSSYFGTATIPAIIENGFIEGAAQCNDRSGPPAYTNVPAELSGLTYLLTARDDRSAVPAENEVLYRVNASAACTAFVLFDNGAGTPSWISADGWTNSGLTVTASGNAYGLYKKYFPAGDIDLKRQISGSSEGTGYVFKAAAGGTVEAFSDASLSGQSLQIRACPNPFNPEVRITIAGVRTGKRVSGSLRLAAYDVHGRMTADLTSCIQANTTVWDAAAAPSGTYVIRLTCGGATAFLRIVLVK